MGGGENFIRIAAKFLDQLSKADPGACSDNLSHVGAGAAYEQMPQPDLSYLAIVEFDDVAGLRAYLEHPAHAEIGRRFWEASAEQLVYDFEIKDVLEVAEWTQDF